MKLLLPKNFYFIFLIVTLISCQNNDKKEQFVFMQDIQEWILPEYSLKSRHIRNEIEQLAQSEPKMYADSFTKRYYTEKGRFIWITRHGIGENADTLLAYLSNVEEDGHHLHGSRQRYCYAAYRQRLRLHRHDDPYREGVLHGHRFKNHLC